MYIYARNASSDLILSSENNKVLSISHNCLGKVVEINRSVIFTYDKMSGLSPVPLFASISPYANVARHDTRGKDLKRQSCPNTC